MRPNRSLSAASREVIRNPEMTKKTTTPRCAMSQMSEEHQQNGDGAETVEGVQPDRDFSLPFDRDVEFRGDVQRFAPIHLPRARLLRSDRRH
jgi:hypothetical protein